MYLTLGTDDQVRGPFDLRVLEMAIQQGSIRPHSLVSFGGGRWHLAFSVPELREIFLKYRNLHEPAVTHLSEARTFAGHAPDAPEMAAGRRPARRTERRRTRLVRHQTA